MALVGTLPLLAGPSALDATTISGTMVVGLGPPVSVCAGLLSAGLAFGELVSLWILVCHTACFFAAVGLQFELSPQPAPGTC